MLTSNRQSNEVRDEAQTRGSLSINSCTHIHGIVSNHVTFFPWHVGRAD